MSFTLISRNKGRAKSQKVLKVRVAYLEDKVHKKHVGKIITAANNLNCDGPGGEDFVSQCIKANEEYQELHLGRPGRPTKTLFIEVTYSSPVGAFLTDAERNIICKKALDKYAQNSACRYAWHINPDTGRSDLHLLLAAKSNDYPPEITIWRKHAGSTGENLYASMDRLGTEIAEELNEKRTPATHLKSAEQVHKETLVSASGKKDLAAELAPLNKSQDDLVAGILELNYNVTKDTKNNVSILFPGAKRASRYNKKELLRQIAKFPVVVEIPQPKKKLPEPVVKVVQKEIPVPIIPVPAEKETKKEPKKAGPWKPTIDWSEEAKKNKGKPGGGG